MTAGALFVVVRVACAFEVAVEGAQLDGMVCLASCDKTVPGQLMAAARLNIPALVIACGIGGFIASFSTHDSLVWSREHYYDTARFPHVFATAKRVPLALVERISRTRSRRYAFARSLASSSIWRLIAASSGR